MGEAWLVTQNESPLWRMINAESRDLSPPADHASAPRANKSL